MLKAVSIAIGFLFVQFASGQSLGDVDPNQETPTNKGPLDPVSRLLSELGDLILDVDKAFNRKTVPEANFENQLKEQERSPTPNSRIGYFDKIRDNYRNLQNKAVSSLNIPDHYVRMSSDLIGVNVQNKGLKSVVDISLPFLPMRLQVNSNGQSSKDQSKRSESTENASAEPDSWPLQTAVPDPGSASSISEAGVTVTDTNIKVESNKLPVEPELLEEAIHARSSKQKPSVKDSNFGELQSERTLQADLEKEQERRYKVSESQRTDSEDSYSSRSDFSEETVMSESDKPLEYTGSGVEGRILGEVLYSESMFDKIMRRVLKDHKKWALDTEFFPSSVMDKLNRASEALIQRNKENVPETTSSKTESPTLVPKKSSSTNNRYPKESDVNKGGLKQDTSVPKPKQSLNQMYYHLDNDKSQNEEDFVLESINGKRGTKVQKKTGPSLHSSREVVLLAFTPDGVPLKLRMGPEIEKPLKFLHKALISAGVSLNIPVDSPNDNEPVGKDILQLGSGNGGMITSAIYIDLSDSYQLNSLLTTLKKFSQKAAGKV